MSEYEAARAAGQQLGRELSTRMVMFHSAVAEHFGLSATEFKCLDVLGRAGPITAGELADNTGLTTGAITKIVDALERRGFVRRERSQTDRRKVIVHGLPQAEEEVGQIFGSLARGMVKIMAPYSEAERAVVADYVTKVVQLLKEETEKLRDEAINLT